MNNISLAPCGLICDLCLGFQRTKNKCVGCLTIGNKPYHCSACSIKTCPEKNGNENLLCYECQKYPCKRIKDLEKRYNLKYGESLIQNFSRIKERGIELFIEAEEEKWKCKQCGQLLCVHRNVCLSCGNKNEYFPKSKL